MHWEQIDDYHQRAKVFGGWLVKAYEQCAHPEQYERTWQFDLRVAMAFVPDPQYQWKLKEEDEPRLTAEQQAGALKWLRELP